MMPSFVGCEMRRGSSPRNIKSVSYTINYEKSYSHTQVMYSRYLFIRAFLDPV